MCGEDRNELGTGCVTGIVVMELFSTKMAGRLVTFTFWLQVFPYCQGSTFSKTLRASKTNFSFVGNEGKVIHSISVSIHAAICLLNTYTHLPLCQELEIQNGNRFSLHSQSSEETDP